MKIDYQQLFPDNSPDEVAYYLVDVFYNLVLAFEGLHLNHVMRHEKAIIEGRARPNHKGNKS